LSIYPPVAFPADDFNEIPVTASTPEPKTVERVDWPGSIGFIGVHVCCLFVFLVGFSWTALAVCILLYVVRMFAITSGYHRYFAHRTFKTSRAFQFVLASIGCSSAQKGPLWWAAHHRHHHKFSDTEEDIHSPGLKGLWWAHAGWILCRKYASTNMDSIRDFAKYGELRFLNRYHVLAPTLLGFATFGLGKLLEIYAPGLGTNGWQMLIWGFFISTTLLYHGTFMINSMAHVLGRRRYRTSDQSRNSLLLALITLGEGWHNNHHFYQSSERQGFFWWEIDISHYGLRVLSWFRIVWELRAPPKRILTAEFIGKQQVS
jgi:stearoyl-CoA desaturase (Delta-9 desaturase)